MSAHAVSSPEAIVRHPNNMWGGGQSPYATTWGKMYMWFFLLSDAFTFSGFLIAYGTLRHRLADIWPGANDVFTHFPFIHGDVPLAYVGLMTFILIMSSVTMVLAVEAGHRNSKKEVLVWMFLTIIGGFMFLGSQAWEWYHFIHGSEKGAYHMSDQTLVRPSKKHEGSWEHVKGPVVLKEKLTAEEFQVVQTTGHHVKGANLKENEYGVTPLFGDFFFFITGFHGFHVFSGVVINIIIFILAATGAYQRRGHYEQVEKAGLYWHFVDLVWVFVFTFFYLL